MSQNYTIFIEGRALSIVHNPRLKNSVLLKTNGKERYVSLLEIKSEIGNIVKTLENGRLETVEIFFHETKNIFNNVKTLFQKHIIAAGGIVFNSNGDILFIFRNGFWDLPKGKMEAGENTQETALREVMEETGIKNLKAIEELPNTYHTYADRDVKVLKETIWFEMFSDDTELIPQTEEGITDIKWIEPKELQEILKQTYPNIIVLMQSYLLPNHES